MRALLSFFVLVCLITGPAFGQSLDVTYDMQHPNDLRADITDLAPGTEYALNIYQRSNTSKWKHVRAGLSDYTNGRAASLSTRDFNIIMARMRPESANAIPAFAASDSRNTLFLELAEGGESYATEALRFGPSINMREISVPTIRGRLYTATWTKPSDRLPLAVILGGSEGGYANKLVAERLATEGYLVLAVAYFGVDGTPPCLANIEINDLTLLIAQAEKDPAYDERGFHLIAVSRGSEYATLYAEAYPDNLRSLTLVALDAYVNGYTNCKKRPLSDAAWTLAEDDTDFIPIEPLPKDKRAVIDRHEQDNGGKDWGFYKRMRNDMYSSAVRDAAKIPLADLSMPVLVMIGEDDRTSNFTQVFGPDDYGATTRVEILKDAGHQIFRPPFQPAENTEWGTNGGDTILFGGNDAANAEGRFKMWTLMLAHLEQN